MAKKEILKEIKKEVEQEIKEILGSKEVTVIANHPQLGGEVKRVFSSKFDAEAWAKRFGGKII